MKLGSVCGEISEQGAQTHIIAYIVWIKLATIDREGFLLCLTWELGDTSTSVVKVGCTTYCTEGEMNTRNFLPFGSSSVSLARCTSEARQNLGCASSCMPR